MDSVTQALLGAAVAESVVGKQAGRKASAWGAFLGIVPDLDILVRFSNPVDSFTYHRSFSHSLLIFILLTPLLTWLILKIHPSFRRDRLRWLWVVALALVTHVLLDSLTIYGTQLFWPVSEYPIGLGSVFIIDPLYSVPLLIGCIAVLISRSARSMTLLKGGLIFSTLYLLWGIAIQQVMQNKVEQILDARNLHTQQLTLTAAPFTSLLWRYVARVDGGYYDGFVSLFDGEQPSAMQFHHSDDHLIAKLQSMPSAARLMWFSKGQFAIENSAGDITISDLRMGVAPDYVFKFKVAELNGNELIEVEPSRINDRNVTADKLLWIWQRISDPGLSLPVGNFAGS